MYRELDGWIAFVSGWPKLLFEAETRKTGLLGWGFFRRLFREVLGGDLLQELVKLGELFFLGELGLVKEVGVARFVEDPFLCEDRRVFPESQGDGIAGACVELYEAAVLAQHQAGVEDSALYIVDEHVVDHGIERGEGIEKQIVGHGAYEAQVLEGDA